MYFVSRKETFAKLFFAVSFSGLFMYILLAFYSFHIALSSMRHEEVIPNQLEIFPRFRQIIKKERFEKDLKYILIWTTPGVIVRNYLEEGQKPFIDYNCSDINCYITSRKILLNEDYRNFDAIVLNMSLVRNLMKIGLPQNRSIEQKYVFHSMLPANENPICNKYLDNYFNLTWSYKLYSDIVTPFIEIRDKNGKVVAPVAEMEWPTKWDLFNSSFVVVPIKKKPKAVVILIEDCKNYFRKDAFLRQLKYDLKKYELIFDVFGCSNEKCPKEGCIEVMRRDYYFYLVFENSSSEDYVTKEVLKAYDNGLVPILIGGANYNNFLPQGSYIDVKDMPVDKLAAIINYTILNPSTYDSYFYWKQHYTIHGVDSMRGICDLCRLLNKQNIVKNYRAYEAFRKWWYYGPLHERCYPKGFEVESDNLSYLKDTGVHRKVFG